MKKKHRRLYFILLLLLLVGLAAGLTLYGLRSGISYFYTPSDIANGKTTGQRVFRLGGLVKKNSIKKNGTGFYFVVTDLAQETVVFYGGLPPSLFREGSGVVATGALQPQADGPPIFLATEILAKHDENYMPPAVAKAIKDLGQWRGQDSTAKQKTLKQSGVEP